jgi:hypothetical protein
MYEPFIGTAIIFIMFAGFAYWFRRRLRQYEELSRLEGESFVFRI